MKPLAAEPSACVRQMPAQDFFSLRTFHLQGDKIVNFSEHLEVFAVQ